MSEAGKGDKRRPVTGDKKKVNSNWDAFERNRTKNQMEKKQNEKTT